jgi:23S rRNA (cytidine1920-2'-O)/16S rRNA (cytidine1409-2'-O)-methyltransferase
LILPAALGLVRAGGHVVALIKPQFEAGREEVSRGAGVIEDPEVHARVLRELEAFVLGSLSHVTWVGVTESPLLGPAGNREFLTLLAKS